LIVGDDLVHDAVDGLLAGVSGTGRQHIDREGVAEMQFKYWYKGNY